MKPLIALLMLTSLVSAGCSHYRHHHKHHRKHWEQMDTNKDGSVSREEFDKAHAEMFTAMDANNDGVVTKEEKKAYFKSKKHRR